MRFFLMIGFFALVLIIGYFASFHKSYEYYANNQYLISLTDRDESDLINEISRLSSTKNEIEDLKSTLNVSGATEVLFNDLVTNLERYNIEIIEVNENEEERDQLSCVVAGSYINLVKAIRFVESNLKMVDLESVNFYIHTNRKTKSSALRLRMVVKRRSDEI